MSVLIMPVASCQISPDLVGGLSIFDDRHIDIYHSHTFGGATQAGQRTGVRNADLRQACVTLSWRPASIGEYNCYNMSE